LKAVVGVNVLLPRRGLRRHVDRLYQKTGPNQRAPDPEFPHSSPFIDIRELCLPDFLQTWYSFVHAYLSDAPPAAHVHYVLPRQVSLGNAL
jgi:hypothetical protein